jgi:hypothetical protein
MSMSGIRTIRAQGASGLDSRRRNAARRPALETMETRALMAVYVGINSPILTEGTSTSATIATYTVSLSTAATTTISVDYGTATTGTATPGVDFTQTSGKIVFLPGEKTKTFDMAVTADSLFESTETVKVLLSNASNATILSKTGTCTIKDDDVQITPELTVNDVRKAEGNSGTTAFEFAVSLTTPVLDQSVTVNVKTADGTAKAGSDFYAVDQILTFAPGETIKTVTVSVVGDSVKEAMEYFYLKLSNASVAIKKAAGNGIINNDD